MWPLLQMWARVLIPLSPLELSRVVSGRIFLSICPLGILCLVRIIQGIDTVFESISATAVPPPAAFAAHAIHSDYKIAWLFLNLYLTAIFTELVQLFTKQQRIPLVIADLPFALQCFHFFSCLNQRGPKLLWNCSESISNQCNVLTNVF